MNSFDSINGRSQWPEAYASDDAREGLRQGLDQGDESRPVLSLQRCSGRWRRLTAPPPNYARTLAQATESVQRDAAITNSYTLHGDAELLFVTAHESGLDFRDQ